ncbi:putative heat shock protein 70 family, peptide-binding domain protein [Tanacetum coccineum]
MLDRHRRHSLSISKSGQWYFDISLLTMSMAAGIISCTVKAVSGTRLGCEDFVKTMIDHCVQEFKKRQKKDVSENPRATMRLKVACEKAIRKLSLTTQTSIEIDSLYEGIDFSMKFTRAKFENLNHGLFKKCIEHVKNCLKAGNMRTYDAVILGGLTHIPKLHQMLIDIFHHEPLPKSFNADEAVAQGVAMVAANIRYQGYEVSEDLILLDVTPLSLGNETGKIDAGVMIPRNATIPTIDRSSVSTEVESIGAKKSKIIVESDNPSKADTEKMMNRLSVEVYLD